jgi:hypothetical protein
VYGRPGVRLWRHSLETGTRPMARYTYAGISSPARTGRVKLRPRSTTRCGFANWEWPTAKKWGPRRAGPTRCSGGAQSEQRHDRHAQRLWGATIAVTSEDEMVNKACVLRCPVPRPFSTIQRALTRRTVCHDAYSEWDIRANLRAPADPSGRVSRSSGAYTGRPAPYGTLRTMAGTLWGVERVDTLRSQRRRAAGVRGGSHFSIPRDLAGSGRGCSEYPFFGEIAFGFRLVMYPRARHRPARSRGPARLRGAAQRARTSASQ